MATELKNFADNLELLGYTEAAAELRRQAEEWFIQGKIPEHTKELLKIKRRETRRQFYANTSIEEYTQQMVAGVNPIGTRLPNDTPLAVLFWELKSIPTNKEEEEWQNLGNTIDERGRGIINGITGTLHRVIGRGTLGEVRSMTQDQLIELKGIGTRRAMLIEVFFKREK